MDEDGWEEVTDPSEVKKILGVEAARSMGGGARGVKGAGLSVQDNVGLNKMREESIPALSVRRDYREVARALDRSNMSPAKAAWMEALVPSENGGLFDKIGASIGQAVLPRQAIDDYQTLRGLQSKRVMDAQVAQKGPQTEADAARLQLAEVSPIKTKQANIGIMKRGMADAVLAERKLPFFQKWASKYGLNGVNERGESADAAWLGVKNKVYNTAESLANAPRKGVAPKGAGRVIDFNSLPE